MARKWHNTRFDTIDLFSCPISTKSDTKNVCFNAILEDFFLFYNFEIQGVVCDA